MPPYIMDGKLKLSCWVCMDRFGCCIMGLTNESSDRYIIKGTNSRTTRWTFLRLINHVINLCTWCKYSHICSGMWFGSFWNRRGSLEFKISHIGISKIKSGYISICTQHIVFGISFSISITLKPVHVFTKQFWPQSLPVIFANTFYG